MLTLGLIVLFFTFSLYAPHIVAVTNSSTTAPVNIIDNVLEPRYDFYTKRKALRWRPKFAHFVHGLLGVQKNRFYFAHVKVGGQKLFLALQTSSATTWIASSQFTCLDPNYFPQLQSTCLRIPALQDEQHESSGLGLPAPQDEQLESSGLGLPAPQAEQLEFSGLGLPAPQADRESEEKPPITTMYNHILLAEYGHWEGDEISSGVLGLALKDLSGPDGIIHNL
ncbi:hypothetical protein BDU57DRAFT_526637 [Ampelomyces quisqualis]|uniref:Peptidase A1 domain-containing protein n=1 Tax=Ampelomyces quisqualis TaxID=50730 RepID=A0A6A5R549_AMPQU|nr:hypothetical protein BDU57DRAFT_526637 [Ampelomyces quisqualis]